jgi:hypothetical protein
MLEQFSSTYDGLPAARFSTARECLKLEKQLAQAGHSFKTKIIPAKRKRPREVIVILLGKGEPDGTRD